MRRLLQLVLSLVLLTTLPAAAMAQDGIGRKEQERIQAKKAKEDKKAKKKKEKADRERFLSLQDKATRKRIKQHGKRADRHGTGRHRDGFFTRLFQRKH